MIEAIIAGAIFLNVNSNLIADMNSADPTGRTMYPSGYKDIDKHIFSAPPSSPYPILNLYRSFLDRDGIEVDPGMYQAVISEDDKNIRLYQGGELKGTFPITEIEYRNYPYAKSSAIYYHRVPFAKIEVKFRRKRAESLIKTN